MARRSAVIPFQSAPHPRPDSAVVVIQGAEIVIKTGARITVTIVGEAAAIVVIDPLMPDGTRTARAILPDGTVKVFAVGSDL